MKTIIATLCLVAIARQSVAAEPTSQPTTKPALVVAGDGFPSGHETPEGVACDLARAFINCNDNLFDKTCIRLYAQGTGPSDYAKFRSEMMKSIQEAKANGGRGGPQRIGKVFAARHLSRSGPASYGYAAFGFQDVVFVDVGVFLPGNKRSLNRTLMIKDRDGLWYVHPMPAASPLLSVGLNDERPSEQDFTDVYEVQR